MMRFDRKKLGFDVLVFAQVKLTAHRRSQVPEFAETIRQFPEVQESHLAEIQEVHSNIVLSEIKYTTELPI